MVRLVVYLLAIALVATGLAWLADRPGTLQIAWQGYDIETSVFRAVVILAGLIATGVFLWSLLRTIWTGPAALGQRIIRRRQKRGLDALSSGLIAAGSGDGALASQYALLARKSLPHEPLTQLLRAQAAELAGDRATARRIYEAMLASPETKQLGLRGLYIEAKREGADEAARQYAGRALELNPKLTWSSDALFEQQCKDRNWSGALETLSAARKGGHISKIEADRKRAVLLSARAIELEESNADQALAQALEAHTLAPDFVPAAVTAGRILASRGQTPKAAKVLQKTWARSPHPDIATIYAHARVGDSTRDRLDRVRQLAALSPHSIEGPIAVAATAIEARLFDDARTALAPLLNDRLTQRVATLMARLEAGENGSEGRVREWLARTVTAARDPVWMADGVISDHWEAISPVTGRLDAYEWRVPVEAKSGATATIEADQIAELLALASPKSATLRDDDVVTAIVVEEEVAPSPATKAAERQSVQAAPERTKTDKRSSVPAAAPTVAAPEDKPAPPPRKDGTNGTGRSDGSMFVTPRAPDDPGTEEVEDVDSPTISRRLARGNH